MCESESEKCGGRRERERKRLMLYGKGKKLKEKSVNERKKKRLAIGNIWSQNRTGLLRFCLFYY